MPMTGLLKKVNSKGFGFIDVNGVDFFFHHTAYQGDWKQLLQRYVSTPEDKPLVMELDNDTTATEGPRAVNVKIKES